MNLSIKGSENWLSVTPVTKGWSTDRKFLVNTKDGRKLLLRVASSDEYEAKKKEYSVIKMYSKLGFSMSMPVEFGLSTDNENVYMLLNWVEGTALEDVLAGLPEREQYMLGRRAGEILRSIHSIPLTDEDIPVKTKRDKKLMQLGLYEECSFRVSGDENAIQYVKDNIGIIWQVPPVYQHGDYHPGNLIYMENGDLGVIDFNRWEAGDPYEEFYKLESFGSELSIPYCIGQIDAYFGSPEKIPDDFWKALAVYVAHASLYSIKWAEKFGREDVEGMTARCLAAMKDYDDFRTYIPRWYTADLAAKFIK